ncbi:MAG: hypothetical protein WCG31_11910 [Deltaproteobacteria bacterium]
MKELNEHMLMETKGCAGDCGVIGILGIFGTGVIAMCGIGPSAISINKAPLLLYYMFTKPLTRR